MISTETLRGDDMQFDPSKVKLFAIDQNTVDMLRIVFRKALGKPVDELVINKLVGVLDENIKVVPSVFKKKEKSSTDSADSADKKKKEIKSVESAKSVDKKKD
jgi:hypothetical protein